MNEIELNRSSHLIDPHLHIWGWEIPVYLFLGGLTAGLMILTPFVTGKGAVESRSRAARLMPFAAPVLLSVGMLALFLDLAYKAHVFRFYGAFRISSPMSWGSWILIAIYPAALLLGMAGLTDRETDALANSRIAAFLRLSRAIVWSRGVALSRLRAVRIANIALGIALGGYTGLLLGTLGARPVWNSSVMGPLFLVSGMSTGAAMMMLFPLEENERRFLRKTDLALVAAELALLAVFLIGLATGGAASSAAAQLFLGGQFTAAFWSLVIVAGLGVPFVIELAETRLALHPTVWAPVLLLIGGLALRAILVSAGQV